VLFSTALRSPSSSAQQPFSTRFLSSTASNGEGKEGEKDKSDSSDSSSSEDETNGESASEDEGSEGEEIDPKDAKIIELETQLEEMKGQVLRSLADQENTRRIASQDMERARQTAIKSFAKSLLEVWDNLGRALEAAEEGGEGKNGSDGIYQGIEMTQSILKKAFEQNGLKQYGEVGEVFDPLRHNAMANYPDPDKKPGTVGQIVKVGFLLHNQVLRPADVMVVSK